ncbi:thiol reductant ABC exporter subunit CydC [Subtercola vilae]|uniref:Thiol reductant ABC exporter subunit CydC n=1 Tax=Subtercola vilae TaxID=2056433 RepID=A0A4T2CDD5_9MICO|nr:thiol reductant ABC exporter subunit CydC [Subtercola vilae]TIH40636.1 thiol reductant ABC exporter subunit CydC [Subtercola vilae]
MTVAETKPNAEAHIVYLLGLISAVRALSLVMIAGALAAGLGGLATGAADLPSAALWGAGGAVLRAVSSWASTIAASRAAVGEKERLRQGIARTALDDPSISVGSAAVLATRGLDHVDAYYSTVLPAVTNAAVIPLLIGARILFADWLSALIVVVTLPLVPIFMALIGMHTRDRVDAASRALGRLSDHLVELARGLPVLVGLGRADEQRDALHAVSDSYRVATVRTLRTAFISSLALELISTISVALVAVTIGFRLMGGTLTLEIGLLVLILAPECFAPFREMGAAFHAAQEGRSSLRSARDLIARRPRLSISRPGPDLRLEEVSVHFAGRDYATLDRLTLAIAKNTTTLLTGRSGSGKSTVLAVLAGQLGAGAPEYELTGCVMGVDADRIAWMSQHPHTVLPTVRHELELYGGTAAIERPERVAEVLESLDLTGFSDVDPAQLSPGELRRVAFARVLLRVDDGADLVLLDEPTAHLDETNAERIERLIAGLSGRVTIVMASHEAGVARIADTVIHLGSPSGLRDTPHSGGTDGAGENGHHDSAVSSPGQLALSDQHAVAMQADQPSRRPLVTATLGELWRFLRPARGHYVASILLGTLSTLFAVSLTAVSGWLIVRASQEPEVMYLLVAIIGVRFFGIGRSALRYCERLVGHDAIFRSATDLRVRLWSALAENGARSRSLFRGSTALDLLVSATDDIRDLSYRAVMPLAVGTMTAVAVLVAVGLLRWQFLPVIMALFVVCLVLIPCAVLVADRNVTERQRHRQRDMLRRFTSMLGAATDLTTNSVDTTVRADLERLDAEVTKDARRIAWVSGFGHALTVLACSATSIVMLAAVWQSVTARTLPLEVAAVLVLLPLALVEPLAAVVDAVLQWPSLASALARTSDFCSGGEPRVVENPHPLGRVQRLEVRELAASWPGHPQPVFESVSFTARTGEWVVVEGCSGSGKSTLLSILLGDLLPHAGSYLIGGADVSTVESDDLHRHITWCPQQGHLFDSTLRANLLLARERSDAPSDAEMLTVLRRIGLDSLVAELSNGLDTRLGPEGSYLSGGQRQRVAVARAVLARSDVVLLDEPTAHLGSDDALTLMGDLRQALADKIVVLITHHSAEALPGDVRVRLGAPARALESSARGR